MSRFVVFAGWDDVPHIDPGAKAALLSSYMPHERDARTKGIPSIGSGAIYPIPEEDILCDPFEFPAWYRHVYALDVGWNRTAAVWLAHSDEDDTSYLYAEYYRGQAEPAVHAAAIRARGDWVPGVVDPASRGRAQKDGEQLFEAYTGLGLRLMPANNAREAGLLEVWGRLSTGRLKVFRTLQNFRAEYRIYRRDEKGAVVKENDHLMDCGRYAVMSGIGAAVIRPFEQWGGRPGMGVLGGGGRGRMEAEYSPYAAVIATGIGGGRGERGSDRQNWLPGKVSGQPY